MYDAFEALDVTVIAVAQEDKDLASHAKMLARFEPDGPRFVVAADFDRATTKRYERTSSYLIGKDGTVLQVFPQTVHYRAPWDALLPELRRRLTPSAARPTSRPAE